MLRIKLRKTALIGHIYRNDKKEKMEKRRLKKTKNEKVRKGLRQKEILRFLI